MPLKAAILGAGAIGAGWAARFLLAGWDVAVHDPAPGAEARLTATLEAARRSLPMLSEVALPPEGSLVMAPLAKAVEGADWVQESAPERLDLKHEIWAEALKNAPQNAVCASSTSGFTPTALNGGKGRIIVAHPFNPVYLLPLVELVGQNTAKAAATLHRIGMYPLEIASEIDGHIADRLLESVWREALWLVKDGVATTEQIDEAIRMGFGPRWAQMGLFETYRLAGGDGGFAQFLAQFGPALKWPWSHLTDVPDLDDALVQKIATQSDAQSGHLTTAELTTQRDNNLVALLRALKQQGSAAGKVLNTHDKSLTPPPPPPGPEPLVTLRRTIPVDWTDYNGHMNESRYGQLWSDAGDTILVAIGMGPDSPGSQGASWFTVDNHIKYLAEVHAGAACEVRTTILMAEGKKLRMHHEMYVGETLSASCTQLLLHIDMETRRSAPPAPEVAEKLSKYAKAHSRQQ
ncbi:carnitine 3-dehydrogenase [Oceanicola sp. D3]|uniref:3-hydroxyacyl-CoA dehydrogenase NAD-binding domain-containing protein n=1 Tax=Oceanicola sp. D3 TaxID=2587163 RepID=UPI00111DA06F|nr:3-hydroxyacyl-CoA dehydrogenase NAD-binding domain-containing protein [Oceanicola sp. D3]QDC09973.1 carnitine 3-dehydrogenase [Oceanicola sp. D3]